MGDGGEYIQITFSFFVKPSKFTIRNTLSANYMPYRFQVVSSVNGLFWDSLGLIKPLAVIGTYDLNITSYQTYSYKYFRLILYQNSLYGRVFLENVYLYELYTNKQCLVRVVFNYPK